MFYGVMALGLVYTARYGYRMLYHHPKLAIQHVIITGGQEQTTEDLQEMLAWVMGQNIVSLDLRQVHDQVMGHPFVAEVTVASELPDGLRIAIVEHKPAALLRKGADIVAVNGSGSVIGRYDAFPKALDLPVMEGVTGTEDERRRLTMGLATLNAIQQTSLVFWDNLETLDLSDPQNMVAHLRNTAAPIYLGSELIPANLHNFLRIAERIQNDYPELAYIELGFPGQIAILPKPEKQE